MPSETVKLLIADCEPEAVASLRDIFQVLGFDAFSTTTSTEVIDIARREKPDAIIMDVRLGPGSDLKLDIIEEIKKINRNAKIIVVSTYYEGSEEFDRIKACGIDKYFTKPISADAIITEIKRLTQ